MLIRFRATNYASLRDEQEISLVSLDDHKDIATTPVPLTKERTLTVAGVFGPNASGKSNLIKAMDFARGMIIESHQGWLPEEPIPQWPFQLDEESRAQASKFVFEFVTGDVRYEYGFSHTRDAIGDEWLYTWPRGKRQKLFERSGMTLDFGTAMQGQKALIAELVRENSLFLSAAAANNHPQLRPVAAWFSRWRQASSNLGSHLDFLSPNLEIDPGTLSLLRFADVGIVGSAVVERPADHQSLGTIRSRKSRLHLNNPPPMKAVELTHKASTPDGVATLPWRWESSGTQMWLWLAGASMRALEQGTILTIDDLGSDLHPLLTAQLIGLFQSSATNRFGAQLIFTGHDVSLLGKHVEHRLRRDQIWLTAKDEGGATKVYPLTEYGRVRDGLDDVEGRYLQGRYGAVPFFDADLLESLTPPGGV